jgi:hypothetical protein
MLLLLQYGELDRSARLAAGAVLLLASLALVLQERRIPEPMLPLELAQSGDCQQ